MSYSLGKVSGRKPGAIVSQSADRMADSLDRIVRQLKETTPLLQGATYDTAKYRAARARSQSLLNRVAGAVGATTMDKGDIQQLLLAGLGRIQAAAEKLKQAARIDSAFARAYEGRLVAQVQRLNAGLVRLASSVRMDDAGAGGLGFVPILMVVGLIALADYLGYLDNTDQVLEEYEAICRDPSFTPEQRLDCYQRVREQVNKENDSDPYGFRGITGSVGTVIKVVGIGAAVAGGAYLLWTFGPALVGAGRKVRQASKKKLSGNTRRSSKRRRSSRLRSKRA